jgi:hypothetical protein
MYQVTFNRIMMQFKQKADLYHDFKLPKTQVSGGAIV